MLLFIGSLVVALLCVRIRGCHLNHSRNNTENHLQFQQEEEGEMAIITDLDQIPVPVLQATVNNNWHLTSGES